MKNRTTNLMITTLVLVLISVSSFANPPLKGTVTYHENPSKPIPSVTVQLWQGDDLMDVAITNINGKYIFQNVQNGTYTIRALNTPIQAGGVNSEDAQMIYNYLYNGLNLTEIEMLAADVDHSGTVDNDDYLEVLANWSIGFQPEWVFAEMEYTVTGTKDNLPTMGGSSSGDVNGTFVPTGRSEEIALVNYFAKQFSSNFTVEVFAKDLVEASAMGLVIDYPSFIDINSVTSVLGDFASLKVENNQIVATWINDNFNSKSINSNEPVLVISAKTNYAYNGSDIRFNISNKSHFVNNGSAFKPEFSIPYLTANGTDNLSYSYPNPATENTMIYFSLPQAANANINIYNLNGQLVKNIINEEMSAGQHSVSVSVTDLEEGVYFYSLTTSGNVNINQAKRLVVVH